MKLTAAEVAVHFGMCLKAATKRRAPTGEMASTKAAAHASAAAEPAAHMTTAEPAPVSTPTSASAAAARIRVGSQSPGKSGSRQ
jgi:hypothetical protein